MDNIQVFLILILIRLIIPFWILLSIGEWNRHRVTQYRFRNEHRADSILQSSPPLPYAKDI
jgi:hypothetical protein